MAAETLHIRIHCLEVLPFRLDFLSLVHILTPGHLCEALFFLTHLFHAGNLCMVHVFSMSS
jgi:hypothetical protein